MKKSLTSRSLEGAFWAASSQGVQYFLRIFTSIILANILFPADFGLMSMAMIALQFARRLANFGLALAIVRLEKVEKHHMDTVFWFNLILMSSITFLLYFTASSVASFFDEARLTTILQVISLEFILKALSSVPGAKLNRRLKFKHTSLVNTIAGITSLILPVILALMGYGVWSLVIGELAGSVINAVIIIFMAKWWPGIDIKLSALKDVFSFGIWVYINNYLNYLAKNLDYIIIGKVFDASLLGLYERAFNFMNMPRARLHNIIDNILFATYSKIQNDRERIAGAVERLTSYISLLSYPLMIWMFFAAPALIFNLYGAKWEGTIEPLQIMCVSGLVNTFTMIFFPVLMATGQMSSRVSRQVIFILVLAAAIVAGVPWGINGIAAGVVFASLVNLLLYLQLMRRDFDFTIRRFLKAQKSAAIYSSVQIFGLIGFHWVSADFIKTNSIAYLVFATLLSAGLFAGSHLVFRFADVSSTIKELMKELRQGMGKGKRSKKKKKPENPDSDENPTNKT